jgi:hypothetical protein
LGGTIEQRADWTDTSRALILAELRRQQASRGGRTLILERREDARGSRRNGWRTSSGCSRPWAIPSSSTAISGRAADQAPPGLDWTLGEDAVAFGRATGMEYALFLHASDALRDRRAIVLRCSASRAA